MTFIHTYMNMNLFYTYLLKADVMQQLKNCFCILMHYLLEMLSIYLTLYTHLSNHFTQLQQKTSSLFFFGLLQFFATFLIFERSTYVIWVSIRNDSSKINKGDDSRVVVLWRKHHFLSLLIVTRISPKNKVTAPCYMLQLSSFAIGNFTV